MVVVSIAAAVAVVAVSPSISHYFDSVSAVASYLTVVTVVTVAIVVAFKNNSNFQALAAKQSILLMNFSWWINITILL